MDNKSPRGSGSEPVRACTISRDVEAFELLIDDMDKVVGEAWGDLTFDEVLAYFEQPEAKMLEFLAVAVDAEDEPRADQIEAIVRSAHERNIPVVLVANDTSPRLLHRILRAGAGEFVPYPLPEGEFQQAVERLLSEPEAPGDPAASGSGGAAEARAALSRTGGHEGVVMAVQGMAGGVGATTFVTNLAWELAQVGNKKPRVCILDLDLQGGSVSTYLDITRRDATLEMLSDVDHMDDEAFGLALTTFGEKDTRLHVLTAPPEMVPLDLLSPDDVKKIIDTARRHFDFVLIDLPKTIAQWSEAVLLASHVHFAMMELDMRSAQNTLRLKRALQSEDLPFDKLRFVLNRAPGFTDLSGRSRVKRMANSLGISIKLLFPDGGIAVSQANDQGRPLALTVPRNALRKEIQKLAKSLHEIAETEATEEAA